MCRAPVPMPSPSATSVTWVIGNDQNALHMADLRRYRPALNSWAWLWGSGASGFPGRYRGVAFSANGKGYVGTGQTEFGNVQDFHEFDPATNGWTRLAENCRSACIGNCILHR